MKQQTALAIGAHPDDIEFRMAGTLLLLKQAGYEIHMMNVANGSGGSKEYDFARTIAVRGREARNSAKVMGAHFHPSLVNDLEIVYDLKTLRRLAAVIREVRPAIILTHPPVDYMEDHSNTCRLVVTAAFTHGMPNFRTLPPRETFGDDVTLYHSAPHGHVTPRAICDPLHRPLVPAAFANTASVHAVKMAALAEHRSQQHWLDVSQGMNSYVRAADDFSLAIGRMSRRFTHAEAWWRHLHYGFSAQDGDPLRESLGRKYLMNKKE